MCLACSSGARAHHHRPGLANPCHCAAPHTQAAFRRVEADISRRQMLGGSAAVLGMFAGFGLAPRDLRAQTPGRPLLLTNLRLFDGQTLAMREGADILVEDGRIAALPAPGQGPEDAEVIDCGGRAVIPGLIDAHWHATMVGVPLALALTSDVGFLHVASAREANDTLMRGFTCVRDVGGPVFGLKLAIDRDVVAGPRIYPSGAMISQTSGHGDFRLANELPRVAGDPAPYGDRVGATALADGVDEVLRRTREQLMKGASQIKIMAGGGVSSPHDPLDSLQYLEEEMEAAVRAAADWQTYVCAHVYTAEGITRAVRAGVRSIEHGQLADEAAVRLMADEGVWWSIQPFLPGPDAHSMADPVAQANLQQLWDGTPTAFEMGVAHGVNMAFGTDILFNPSGGESQGRQLAMLTRFMSPLEALRTATGGAGELLALSGPRAPYQGPLGVIAPGALADLLVVDGDPEADLDWLGDPGANLRLIMKGGSVVKETL